MKIFVTVGTTEFDKLIDTLSDSAIVDTLVGLGYSHMTMQIGRGIVEPMQINHDKFTVDFFRYKNTIVEDINAADLVISHAGAGSCLEVLSAQKPLIIVINEDLMSNHQVELAQKLFSEGYLLYCTCKTLLTLLSSMNLFVLKPFEASCTPVFAAFMDTAMEML